MKRRTSTLKAHVPPFLRAQYEQLRASDPTKSLSDLVYLALVEYAATRTAKRDMK